MGNENFFNMGNESFMLDGYKCDIHSYPISEEEEGIAIIPRRDNPIRYAFSGSNGLCITTQFGSVLKTDLLGEFLSAIDNAHEGNHPNHYDFIKEYGFFFPVKEEDHFVISKHDFESLCYRLRYVVLLYNMLNQEEYDYKLMLKYIVFLIISGQLRIPIGERATYSTCHYHVVDMLKEPLYSSLSADDAQEAAAKGSYTVKDLFLRKNNELNAEEYSDIITGEEFTYNYWGIKDPWYRKLVYLYKNAHSETKSNRLLIDFLFHLMHDIGVIRGFDPISKEIVFYEPFAQYDIEKKLDASFQRGLMDVSRVVLSMEITHNVGLIKPYFDPNTLRGTWKASSLLSALYFSIFYREPNSQIYRRCANPSCGKYFLVPVTNSRKIYCDDACRNAKNQRDHRFRAKENR